MRARVQATREQGVRDEPGASPPRPGRSTSGSFDETGAQARDELRNFLAREAVRDAEGCVAP